MPKRWAAAGGCSRAQNEEVSMATRALAFAVKLRDARTGRTVRVLQDRRDPRRYRVEDARRDREPQQREHGSLADALRDLAASWRRRLN